MRSAAERGMTLYGSQGERKYLNQAERRRVIEAFGRLERGKALFALTLAWTGARVSKVLNLRAHSFQVEQGRVSIRTLKRRKLVVREVPMPRELMDDLDRYFRLRDMQRSPARAGERLWLFCRETAWRFIRHVMKTEGVTGLAGCPRGLRHAFAVGALQAEVPLHLVQRWLGHARMSTTIIYANVQGAEEEDFAARFWRVGESRRWSVADAPRALRVVWLWMTRQAWSLVGGIAPALARLAGRGSSDRSACAPPGQETP
jgi:integrase